MAQTTSADQSQLATLDPRVAAHRLRIGRLTIRLALLVAALALAASVRGLLINGTTPVTSA